MTAPQAVLGVDIGTSSSKGVLVAMDGTLLASATRQHHVDRPRPGHVEMDATVWWDELVSLSRELTGLGTDVVAIGVSGMGSCVLLTDEEDRPVRRAVLYGVDTRATDQIAALNARYGDTAIRSRGGSSLSTQAAGAKVLWVAEEEPELFARARRLYMPNTWLVRGLTGAYVMDHNAASMCNPLYDIEAEDWYQPWVDDICPRLEMPPLRWASEVAGGVHSEAAATTGLPAGVPVVTGALDAWAEAVSVDAHRVGDLMLMYGTTMFLINTVTKTVTSPSLWATAGALPGTRCLAGGMATSGAITGWLRELFGDVPYADLVRLASKSPPGANGLLMLPYLAGERTPVMDPHARGVLAGLTLTHTRGDLYRCALEAVGFGVRHNIETIERAGGDVRRVVAVGGGTQGDLWTQIVSDITGLEQVVPTRTIGASYGDALLAAQAVDPTVSIADWNPVREVRSPRQPEIYADLYPQYLELYAATRDIAHALAARQLR